MRLRWHIRTVIALPWLALSAAATAGPGYIPPQYYPVQYAPEALPSDPQAGPLSSPPSLTAPAQEGSKPSKDEKKDDKRGNTPPGMDRSGGGPASGAILDPTGAVTREPVLRDR